MGSKVFFSSCFEDPTHERLRIRDRVAGLNVAAKAAGVPIPDLPVWLAENYPELRSKPPFDIARFCINGVRASDVYVAVVRSRWGSEVHLPAGERIQASFFELELFEAALLRKPAFVFVLDGGEMSPRLKGLLELLAPALPGLQRHPLTEDQIYGRVATILDRQSRPRIMREITSAAGRLFGLGDRLTRRRFHAYDPTTETPGFTFLDGFIDPSAEPPSASTVDGILHQLPAEPDYHVRLTLIWAAIRELMGAPPDRPSSLPFMPRWEAALGAWAASGAWYGLHGHPFMGCLAALGSITEFKRAEGTLPDAPHGAIASEYYSISRMQLLPDRRSAMLAKARQHVDIAALKGETAGVLGLRGSIQRTQGDYHGAIIDYEAALHLRQTVEASNEAQIGEAMSELGFALVFAGRGRRGLDLMEEGLTRMQATADPGFIVRATRKLGRAYLRSAAPLRALDALARAYELSTDHGALDQVRAIDWLAWEIARRLPSRPRRVAASAGRVRDEG